MNEREKFLKKIQIGEFVAWEMQIYLDTHPNDTDVLNKLESEKISNEKLVKEYESKFGPIKEPISDKNKYAWISTPWPWENGEVCD